MAITTLNFEELISFIRAGAASRINSSGILEFLTANQKRLDYKLGPIAPIGLRISPLVEQQIVNPRLTQSPVGDITSWNEGGCIAGVDVGVKGIDNVTDITWLEDTSTAATQGASRASASASANVAGVNWLAVSCVKKRTSGKALLYGMRITNDGQTINAIFDVDSATPTGKFISTTGKEIAVGAEDGPNGLAMVWMAVSSSLATSATLQLIPAAAESAVQTNAQLFAATNALQNTATGSHYVDGVMLEQAVGLVYPHPFVDNINTVGVIGQKQPEIASISGETFTKNFKTSDSTIIVDAFARKQTSTADEHLFCISDGTIANSIRGYRQATTNKAFVVVTTAGVAQATFDLGAWATGTRKKIALAFSSGSFQAAFNGAAATPVSGTLPSGLNRIHIGSDCLGAKQWDSTIASVAYEPKVFTESELLAAIA